MYSLLVVLFAIVVLGGLVWAYIAYLNQKSERLNLINRGICPKCKQESIELIDQKGGGCSGTSFVEFKCSSCDYHDSFNIGGGSCGSGSCRV